MTCPHASNPKTCVEEKSRRHYHLLPFQPVECDYCPHAYANGLAAPRPVEETIPFKGSGSVRRCTECGGRVGNSNKSGICQECIGLLFGGKTKRRKPGRDAYNPQDKCPHGHNDWGFKRIGERYCKECNRGRLRQLRMKRRAA